MRRILKSLMLTFGVGLLNSYRRLSLDLLKLRAAAVYVRAVQTARRWWIGALLLAGVLLLLAAGFVMLHVGFFLWAPWSPATKGLVLLALGLAYMLLALAVIFKLCSEKAWLEGSQASKLIEAATRNQEQI